MVVGGRVVAGGAVVGARVVRVAGAEVTAVLVDVGATLLVGVPVNEPMTPKMMRRPTTAAEMMNHGRLRQGRDWRGGWGGEGCVDMVFPPEAHGRCSASRICWSGRESLNKPYRQRDVSPPDQKPIVLRYDSRSPGVVLFPLTASLASV
jgi:hypothetical protein